MAGTSPHLIPGFHMQIDKAAAAAICSTCNAETGQKLVIVFSVVFLFCYKAKNSSNSCMSCMAARSGSYGIDVTNR